MAFDSKWSESELKKHLRNMSTGAKVITKQLEALSVGTPFNDNMIESLLGFHPSFEEKQMGGIRHLVLRRSQPYNTIVLFFETWNGVQDDVSYKLCIRNLFGKFDTHANDIEKTKKAFRNDVYHQVYAFRSRWDEGAPEQKVCAHCGHEPGFNRHVDHYNKPFGQLLEEFMYSEKMRLADIKLRKTDNGIIDATMADEELKRRWVRYHGENASLRMVCKTCNLSLGRQGWIPTTPQSRNIQSCI